MHSIPTLLLNGEPIGTVKGMLFDKDGTLSDSEDHLVNIAKLRVQEASRLLIKEGATDNTVRQLKRLLSRAYGLTSKGLSPNGTIAIASRNNNLISTATIFCLLGETWPNAYTLSSHIFQSVDILENGLKNNAEKRKTLPGVKTILRDLKNADVVCALISNDSHQGIQTFLARNNLKDLFANVWSADNSPTKPDPAAVEGLCKKINIKPSECALIGDADSDLLMARQSGIGITLGYTGGWTQTPQLTQHNYLIKNWNELTIEQAKPYSKN